MGITSDFKKKKMEDYPAIEPKPYNEARKHMTYAEAVEDNKRMKLAQETAKKAKEMVLNGMSPAEALKQSNPFLKSDKKQS